MNGDDWQHGREGTWGGGVGEFIRAETEEEEEEAATWLGVQYIKYP